MEIWNCEGHFLERPFFTNGIIDSRMNSKYLKFAIIKLTPWKNTFDIGNLANL
jgi:hypothetical protein